jgi:hypothetical protein
MDSLPLTRSIFTLLWRFPYWHWTSPSMPIFLYFSTASLCSFCRIRTARWCCSFPYRWSFWRSCEFRTHPPNFYPPFCLCLQVVNCFGWNFDEEASSFWRHACFFKYCGRFALSLPSCDRYFSVPSRSFPRTWLFGWSEARVFGFCAGRRLKIADAGAASRSSRSLRYSSLWSSRI